MPQFVRTGVLIGLSFSANFLHCLSADSRGAPYWSVRKRLLINCSQVLLLPLGVPPMLVLAYFTFSHSHDGKLCRMLSTTVTQGQGSSASLHGIPSMGDF